MKLPLPSVSSIFNWRKKSIVLGRCNLAKMVLKPVAIVSALSRVVLRTAVNNDINSVRLPPAALKAPPARLTASMISPDSTANFLDTALIEPSWVSSLLASVPNCAIIATAPSVLDAILSNVAANVVLASVLIACSVCFAVKPDCARTTLVLAITVAERPNSLDKSDNEFCKAPRDRTSVSKT